jgi:hypothetical protein
MCQNIKKSKNSCCLCLNGQKPKGCILVMVIEKINSVVSHKNKNDFYFYLNMATTNRLCFTADGTIN